MFELELGALSRNKLGTQIEGAALVNRKIQTDSKTQGR